MKRKPTLLLATFVATLGLLLAASAAQAATVITDGDGNVTRIENLEVFDDASDSTIFYNVEFVYDTAINVYSSGEFDFSPSENAVVALVAVNEALNAEDPIPPGAGPQGSDQFFIGAIEYFGRVVAAGGQRFTDIWGGCEDGSESECILGTAVLDPDEDFTYAKFTEIQDVPPGQATLVSPSDTISDNTPTYTWNAVAGATWYNLSVNDSAGNPVINEWHTADAAGCDDGMGECSVIPVTVLADGSHRWWIRASNQFGDGDWSNPLSFTVDTGEGVALEKATLISPSGTITDNSPTYTWNAVANATWYRLAVIDSTGQARSEWYSADRANCGSGTGECSAAPETVLADGAAWWWIQTWNEFETGPWSDSLSFWVDTGILPGQATLISPSGTISDNTPTYTWNAVADATSYTLDVLVGGVETFEVYTADDAGCGDGTGECTVTPATELADGTYKWWIQTTNESGDGRWSDGLSFTVNTGTGPEVILDENGNVTRIENLPVVDETTGDTIIYNVRFVNDQAIDVYGIDFNFNFSPPEDDETIVSALEAVTDVLNAEDPIPPGASAQGTGQFFIGYKETAGPIVAVGGEIIAGAWGQCETDCITGVAFQGPYDFVTWADFDRVVAPDVVQVFITEGTYRGDLGGLAGADAECQARAEEAGLPGTWTAWLSTSLKDLVPGEDAIDRIPDGGPYQLVDGTVIADDKADLTDGTLDAPIDLNQYGSPGGGSVWTGTQPDGTDSGTNCNNWTEGTSGAPGCTAGDLSCGVVGDSSARFSDWTQTSDGGQQCGNDFPLYCFGSSE